MRPETKLNNAMIMLVAAVNAPIIGWLLSIFSKESALSISDYQQAFVLIIVLMIAALMLSIFFIKETHTTGHLVI